MAVGNNPNSPRQKMINLMYLVFIAMMVLNVSSEVLDGFVLVEDSLHNSIDNSIQRNEIVENELKKSYDNNPEKVRVWYERGLRVKALSDSLYNYIQDLKVQIVKVADGSKGDVLNINHKDDLEAASRIMLAPISGQGRRLREAIEAYRNTMAGMISDPEKTKILESTLSTSVRRTGINTRTWEEALFENMPVAAAVTMLTKLQSDIRAAEGEVMTNLLTSVDVGDSRVNLITAQVIPESRVVVSGTDYKATVVLSAIDSTQQPTVYLGEGDALRIHPEDRGIFSIRTGATGNFTAKGRVEMMGNDGQMMVRSFESDYMVIEPSATVAPVKMNVLYTGYDNPLRIAVPGIPNASVSASMTNGVLLDKGGGMWEARPATAGTPAVVTVNARMADGRVVQMGSTSFRVLPLPPPVPYIAYKDQNGTMRKFKGGSIAKRSLIEADGILAAYDDDLLDATFTVVRFELNFYDSFGNMIPQQSPDTHFTERQKAEIRNLPKGKRFYVSRVVVRTPEGSEQALSTTLEVIIN
ncbi:MAG: gliding motility protein GldM [Tannerellaceae bacterium]|jgi:gliding motility-associated protein GldM|nr:gliding motility protein GldM [Tannerellaceae bacterium]